MEENDFYSIPMLGELETISKRDCILKIYNTGSRPRKMKVVSYVDAESALHGTFEDDNGMVTHFVCDGCKKKFKADKANAIKIHLTNIVIDDMTVPFFNYERAYCGRCIKKTQALSQKIYEAIHEFEDEEA